VIALHLQRRWRLTQEVRRELELEKQCSSGVEDNLGTVIKCHQTKPNLSMNASNQEMIFLTQIESKEQKVTDLKCESDLKDSIQVKIRFKIAAADDDG